MTVLSTSTTIRTRTVMQASPMYRGAIKGPVEGTPDETSLSFWLKGLISNKIDLWKISNRLNVNPSTVQKVLDGRPVSRYITKKFAEAFRSGIALNEKGSRHKPPESTRSTIERLVAVCRLYEEERSLRTVGKRLGLSRERVRQLLEKGSEIGFFEYKPLKPPIRSQRQPDGG